MNKILIIGVVAIIGGLVLLGAGYLVGVSLEKEKTGPQLEKLDQLNKEADVLESLGSSKVISSVIAYGQVTEISGDTITLVYGTESLPIKIKEDAKISSFVSPTPAEQGETGAPEQKTASFGDIKVGDSLNVNLRILSDGQVEGLSVVILSPVAGAR